MSSGTVHARRLSPYLVLGLPSTATKEEVKDAFRKLCLQYHPDRVSGGASGKANAERHFRIIKSAYDEILKGQAGYAPPPPGAAPSSTYAKAWYKAHYGGVEPEGPVRCGGPYGGFATEGDFYRSMFRSTRNSPTALLLAGLAAIPLVAAAVNIANGNTGWITRFKNEGIFMFTDNRFKVNGRDMVRHNPFSIRSEGSGDSMQDSYIYKSDRYKHLRAKQQQQQQQTAAAAQPPEQDVVVAAAATT